VFPEILPIPSSAQGNQGWISALNQKGTYVVEVKQRGLALDVTFQCFFELQCFGAYRCQQRVSVIGVDQATSVASVACCLLPLPLTCKHVCAGSSQGNLQKDYSNYGGTSKPASQPAKLIIQPIRFPISLYFLTSSTLSH
jgi:hypothetical protein